MDSLISEALGGSNHRPWDLISRDREWSAICNYVGFRRPPGDPGETELSNNLWKQVGAPASLRGYNLFSLLAGARGLEAVLLEEERELGMFEYPSYHLKEEGKLPDTRTVTFSQVAVEDFTVPIVNRNEEEREELAVYSRLTAGLGPGGPPSTAPDDEPGGIFHFLGFAGHTEAAPPVEKKSGTSDGVTLDATVYTEAAALGEVEKKSVTLDATLSEVEKKRVTLEDATLSEVEKKSYASDGVTLDEVITSDSVSADRTTERIQMTVPLPRNQLELADDKKVVTELIQPRLREACTSAGYLFAAIRHDPKLENFIRVLSEGLSLDLPLSLCAKLFNTAQTLSMQHPGTVVDGIGATGIMGIARGTEGPPKLTAGGFSRVLRGSSRPITREDLWFELRGLHRITRENASMDEMAPLLYEMGIISTSGDYDLGSLEVTAEKFITLAQQSGFLTAQSATIWSDEFEIANRRLLASSFLKILSGADSRQNLAAVEKQARGMFAIQGPSLHVSFDVNEFRARLGLHPPQFLTLEQVDFLLVYQKLGSSVEGAPSKTDLVKCLTPRNRIISLLAGCRRAPPSDLYLAALALNSGKDEATLEVPATVLLQGIGTSVAIATNVRQLRLTGTEGVQLLCSRSQFTLGSFLALLLGSKGVEHAHVCLKGILHRLRAFGRCIEPSATGGLAIKAIETLLAVESPHAPPINVETFCTAMDTIGYRDGREIWDFLFGTLPSIRPHLLLSALIGEPLVFIRDEASRELGMFEFPEWPQEPPVDYVGDFWAEVVEIEKHRGSVFISVIDTQPTMGLPYRPIIKAKVREKGPTRKLGQPGLVHLMTLKSTPYVLKEAGLVKRQGKSMEHFSISAESLPSTILHRAFEANMRPGHIWALMVASNGTPDVLVLENPFLPICRLLKNLRYDLPVGAALVLVNLLRRESEPLDQDGSGSETQKPSGGLVHSGSVFRAFKDNHREGQKPNHARVLSRLCEALNVRFSRIEQIAKATLGIPIEEFVGFTSFRRLVVLSGFEASASHSLWMEDGLRTNHSVPLGSLLSRMGGASTATELVAQASVTGGIFGAGISPDVAILDKLQPETHPAGPEVQLDIQKIVEDSASVFRHSFLSPSARGRKLFDDDSTEVQRLTPMNRLREALDLGGGSSVALWEAIHCHRNRIMLRAMSTLSESAKLQSKVATALVVDGTLAFSADLEAFSNGLCSVVEKGSWKRDSLCVSEVVTLYKELNSSSFYKFLDLVDGIRDSALGADVAMYVRMVELSGGQRPPRDLVALLTKNRNSTLEKVLERVINGHDDLDRLEAMVGLQLPSRVKDLDGLTFSRLFELLNCNTEGTPQGGLFQGSLPPRGQPVPHNAIRPGGRPSRHRDEVN